MIDKFVEKLASTIESKLNDYKAFIELQAECVQMLENFNDHWSTDLEGLRRLGYFRLEVNYLIRNYFKSKNAADFEQKILSSVEYLLDFLDLELSILDTKSKFPSVAIKNDVGIKSDYTWTGNKTDLIEILQGILLLQSINDGKVKKNDFILFMGKVFNVDLKNHSGLFNDILNRYDDPNQLDSRITYLRRMIDALSNRLRELDRSATRHR